MNKNLSKQLKEQQADKILLQAIAASADADAFLILYNRYSQRLLQYFYNVTDNADTAFDLSQNFWLNIWQTGFGRKPFLQYGNKTYSRLLPFPPM